VIDLDRPIPGLFPLQLLTDEGLLQIDPRDMADDSPDDAWQALDRRALRAPLDQVAFRASVGDGLEAFPDLTDMTIQSGRAAPFAVADHIRRSLQFVRMRRCGR